MLENDLTNSKKRSRGWLLVIQSSVGEQSWEGTNVSSLRQVFLPENHFKAAAFFLLWVKICFKGEKDDKIRRLCYCHSDC